MTVVNSKEIYETAWIQPPINSLIDKVGVCGDGGNIEAGEEGWRQVV